MIIILILAFYVLPGFTLWYFLSKAHYHPEGSFYNVPLDNGDLCILFIPGANIIGTLEMMFTWKDVKFKRHNLWRKHWK